MPEKHLILGGARSGKSSFAEQQTLLLAKAGNKQCVYIATATAGDEEMRNRILRHQQDRDSEQWQLTESPLNLGLALDQVKQTDTVLIDCLTLWLSNCLHEDCWQNQKTKFLSSLDNCIADVIMVSNEVGSGVIPMGELSRTFVDELGWLHQQLARSSNHVTQVIAGLPNKLK